VPQKRKPLNPPRPPWMKYKTYWYLRKHDRAKLHQLIATYGRPRERDHDIEAAGLSEREALEGFRAAMDRDGTA